MRPRLSFAVFLTLLAAGPQADSAELIREFKGRGATTTAEFEVQAPWILDWRVNSEYQKSMKIEVHLVDGVTGFHKGLVLETKYAGNGVRMFNESGRFRFRISATLADWTLKVEQLSREEAKLYTPRQ